MWFTPWTDPRGLLVLPTSTHCYIKSKNCFFLINSLSFTGLLHYRPKLSLVPTQCYLCTHYSQLLISLSPPPFLAWCPISFHDGGLLAKAHLSPNVPVRRTGSPGRGAWLLTVDTCSCTWTPGPRTKRDWRARKGLGRGVMGPWHCRQRTGVKSLNSSLSLSRQGAQLGTPSP